MENPKPDNRDDIAHLDLKKLLKDTDAALSQLRNCKALRRLGYNKEADVALRDALALLGRNKHD